MSGTDTGAGNPVAANSHRKRCPDPFLELVASVVLDHNPWPQAASLSAAQSVWLAPNGEADLADVLHDWVLHLVLKVMHQVAELDVVVSVMRVHCR